MICQTLTFGPILQISASQFLDVPFSGYLSPALFCVVGEDLVAAAGLGRLRICKEPINLCSPPFGYQCVGRHLR